MSGAERPEHRLKRLAMRAARRGTKEMDLILGPYAVTHLPDMAEDELDLFEALLDENDQDLYRWVTGQEAPPAEFTALMVRISASVGLETAR